MPLLYLPGSDQQNCTKIQIRIEVQEKRAVLRAALLLITLYCICMLVVFLLVSACQEAYKKHVKNYFCVARVLLSRC